MSGVHLEIKEAKDFISMIKKFQGDKYSENDKRVCIKYPLVTLTDCVLDVRDDYAFVVECEVLRLINSRVSGNVVAVSRALECFGDSEWTGEVRSAKK